jgi:hypothetical protein
MFNKHAILAASNKDKACLATDMKIAIFMEIDSRSMTKFRLYFIEVPQNCLFLGGMAE